MLPRLSALQAPAPEQASPVTLSTLPTPIVHRILSLVPPPLSRLRCAEVCRAWRAALAEPGPWTHLDLLDVNDVHPYRGDAHARARMDVLLRGFAARAGGALVSLHVDLRRVTWELLLKVLADNVGTLRELHTSSSRDPGVLTRRFSSPRSLEQLLRAAPRLRTLVANLYAVPAAAETRRALRNEAPFGPLRVRLLHASFDGVDTENAVAFAADVAAHTSIAELIVYDAHLDNATVLDAVVGAAMALPKLQAFNLHTSWLSLASASHLARMFRHRSLTTLEMDTVYAVDGWLSPSLTQALRSNATLTSLTLTSVGLFRDPGAGAALLGALTGHARLQELRLIDNSVPQDGDAIVGAALGELVAANTPALTYLDTWSQCLRDDCLRPLFEALPQNTHLRTLDCQSAGTTDDFNASVVLPAVRANGSLRRLELEPRRSALDEAMQLVQDRNQ